MLPLIVTADAPTCEVVRSSSKSFKHIACGVLLGADLQCELGSVDAMWNSFDRKAEKRQRCSGTDGADSAITGQLRFITPWVSISKLRA